MIDVDNKVRNLLKEFASVQDYNVEDLSLELDGDVFVHIWHHGDVIATFNSITHLIDYLDGKAEIAEAELEECPIKHCFGKFDIYDANRMLEVYYEAKYPTEINSIRDEIKDAMKEGYDSVDVNTDLPDLMKIYFTTLGFYCTIKLDEDNDVYLNISTVNRSFS